MKDRTCIQVNSKTAPVVELDSVAHAAYVRFSRSRVAQTKVVTEDKYTITIDLDSAGEIVGVELVGVEEFSIGRLMKMANVSAPKPLLNRARYVAAELEPV